MAAWLLTDVKTLATCVQITRTDGTVFGFTDHDTNLTVGGVVYASSAGYTASAIEASADMSTSNLEIDGLLLASGGAIVRADVEAGVWSNAAVLIFSVNYADLTMGQLNLTSGNLGQFTLQNGNWKVELRGLAQTMQQTITPQYSATCRAQFGDGKCLIAGGLSPLTFSGSVSSIVTAGLVWNDPTLTQAGPVMSFTDTVGHQIPTASPYQVQIVPPSGAFEANVSATDNQGNVYSQVSGSPSAGHQYSVSADGLYTFDSNDAQTVVFIDFTYTIGYFAYGNLTWTSGANEGLVSQVKTFAPGVVTLGLPPPNPIAVGDTYSIVAGCDKTFGRCQAYGNIIHFRGEPFIPGPDVLLAPQS